MNNYVLYFHSNYIAVISVHDIVGMFSPFIKLV